MQLISKNLFVRMIDTLQRKKLLKFKYIKGIKILKNYSVYNIYIVKSNTFDKSYFLLTFPINNN